MKKIILLAVIALCLPLCQGCNTDKTRIINQTNRIYASIRIIVIDKDVAPLISDSQREILIEVEEKYLTAVKLLENANFDEDEKESLNNIVECADIIIQMLDTIELSDEYREKIAAVRVLLKVLRVYIE